MLFQVREIIQEMKIEATQWFGIRFYNEVKVDMKVFEWVVIALSIYLTVTFMFGIRRNTFAGVGVTIQTITTTMLWFVSFVIIYFVNVTYFHMLWILPLGLIIGSWFVLIFPVSLLQIPAGWFASLCCIGLSRQKMSENKRRYILYSDLKSDGLSHDEAMRRVNEKSPL